MLKVKAPILNGIAALLNLTEGLFWTGSYLTAPNDLSQLGITECLVTAVENALLFVIPYCEKNDAIKNGIGAGLNLILGGLHYMVNYVSEHSFGVRYSTVSVSGIMQPVVNMGGLGANALEAYSNKKIRL